ncbi:carbon-nitrogen hydrolase [Gilvimarinus agarilyticus]|uniref:carbon-nitrogen hydrolase n=1 Tax=Gilvimarinus sp. 2_MG-2023 TaxID=3062666 RepID=UPI001C0A1945|nr:carbon-nitrogen hydrolase [Gilvimarinus sp. 2_MG-2023]MBU2887026.1 carbon-nitrogen hydrolase [Gilvimarinus agarilyticus]MDO6571686.1 carbon-nitrogen hydrolase [Gilvimarinus sp. 2_MG-2023]
MVNNLKVGVIQQTCSADLNANMDKTQQTIRALANQGAQLIVLQELYRGLYFCQQEDVTQFDQAEPIPGPSTDVLGVLAKELGVVIVVSLFEKRAAGLYHNTAVVLERNGDIAGTYRKMHIPDDPGFYEKFYFTPGDKGFEPIDTSVGRLGILVCWDQWFPEAARLMAMAGAQILIYPTAIGWCPSDDPAEKKRQKDAWVTVQRAHAIANGLPVISVNRVGHEDDPAGGEGIDFWGNSFVTGPQGEFLTELDATEQAQVVNIDLQRSEDVRRIWPFLRDRRIDDYQDLTKRYRD